MDAGGKARTRGAGWGRIVRHVIVWAGPLPLAVLPWAAMVIKNVWRHDPVPWKHEASKLAYEGSKWLIGPGLICGIPLRSDWAIVVSAGLFWYCLGAAVLGVVLLRGKKEQRALLLPALLVLGWVGVILLLMFLFRNFDPD